LPYIHLIGFPQFKEKENTPNANWDGAWGGLGYPDVPTVFPSLPSSHLLTTHLLLNLFGQQSKKIK
jgi:hypothetical protein